MTSEAQPPEVQRDEVLVDGRYIDVTEFKKRHPGGRVMNFYFSGKEDATSAFRAFHSRSEKAHKILKALPSREKTEQDETQQEKTPEEIKSAAIMADFEVLRADLEKEGFFKPSPLHIAYRLAELVLMHIVGIWLLANGWTAPAILILGIVQGRCGWFMHEGGHYSLTGNIPADRLIQVFAYGLGCGMSGSWWRSQHNRHHAMPQRLKHDVDLDTLPLVAFNIEIGKRGAPAWLRLQAYLFSPLTCLLVGLGWQFYLHPRHAIRTKQHLELVAFALRYIFIGVLSWYLEFSIGKAILLYVLYVWAGSAYIFTNFSLSHTHTPVLQPNDKLDWVRYASNHTVNIEPTFWVDWWMGYLNYQIEHHLFPSMPQYRNRAAGIRVRKLFEKHGLEYKVLSYVDALKITLTNLDQVGREVSTLKQKKVE